MTALEGRRGAEVAEQALLPEQVDVDPTRLRPEDCLAGDLGYHLESLAFCELLELT